LFYNFRNKLSSLVKGVLRLTQKNYYSIQTEKHSYQSVD